MATLRKNLRIESSSTIADNNADLLGYERAAALLRAATPLTKITLDDLGSSQVRLKIHAVDGRVWNEVIDMTDDANPSHDFTALAGFWTSTELTLLRPMRDVLTKMIGLFGIISVDHTFPA